MTTQILCVGIVVFVCMMSLLYATEFVSVESAFCISAGLAIISMIDSARRF